MSPRTITTRPDIQTQTIKNTYSSISRPEHRTGPRKFHLGIFMLKRPCALELNHKRPQFLTRHGALLDSPPVFQITILCSYHNQVNRIQHFRFLL